MKLCPSCGKTVADGDRFCGNCGTSLTIQDQHVTNEHKETELEPAGPTESVASSVSPPQTSPIIGSARRGRCKYCGQSIAIGATPCPHCGHELKWVKRTTVAAKTPSVFLGVPSSESELANMRARNGQTSSAGAIILGVLSLIGCFLPIVGVPLAIVGLVVSGSKKNMVGGILCTVGLILSIVNAISGGIKGAQAEREYEMRRNADQFIQEWNKAFR